MAKATAAPKPEPQETALVPMAGTDALALPADLLDELSDLGALDDLGREDRPIPFKAYNVRLQDADGSWIPRDQFFDTLTEETAGTIDAILLHLKKSRRNAEYIEGVGTKVRCRSMDCVTGTPEEGGTRACATCPLKEWAGGEKPQCGVLYNFVGLDLSQNLSPFVVRAKATSLAPARKYIAKWFSGKLRLAGGKIADLPLFVYRTRLSLEMPTGNYSVLKFENIGACTEDEIRNYKSLYDHFKDSAKVARAVETEAPETPAGAGPDAGDDTPDFLKD